jgi:putative sugar O-methyltransferase
VHPSLSELRAIYDRAAAYIESAGDATGHLSEFWREHLSDDKRRNYPAFEEMLVMRRGFTYPLADRAKVEDREAERAYAEGAWRVVAPSVEPGWLDRVQESALGSPVAFALDGHTLTAGGVVNALTASRIAHWCARAGLTDRPLRVLEIGPGYGNVAHQLMQALDIASYAVCDLPENLFLAAFYLMGNFPDRSAAFAGQDDDATLNESGLAFTIPPLVDRLDGPFDLILNSYSFQEMTRESVAGYFELAERLLAPDGVFYSFNAHGKAGIERASQYPVGRFRLESLRPVRRYPWQMFGTTPYELVMRPGRSALDPDTLVLGLDALGGGMQSGLHDELLPLCEAFPAGTADTQALTALAGWAHGGGLDAVADSGSLPDGVAAYMRGSALFATGGDDAARDELERATLGESHAAVRCATMLAATADDEPEREPAIARAVALAPHLEEEIRRLSADRPSFAAMVASQLSLPAPRPDAPAGRLSRIWTPSRRSAGSRPPRPTTNREGDKT